MWHIYVTQISARAASHGGCGCLQVHLQPAQRVKSMELPFFFFFNRRSVSDELCFHGPRIANSLNIAIKKLPLENLGFQKTSQIWWDDFDRYMTMIMIHIVAYFKSDMETLSSHLHVSGCDIQRCLYSSLWVKIACYDWTEFKRDKSLEINLTTVLNSNQSETNQWKHISWKILRGKILQELQFMHLAPFNRNTCKLQLYFFKMFEERCSWRDAHTCHQFEYATPAFQVKKKKNFYCSDGPFKIKCFMRQNTCLFLESGCHVSCGD